jgi:hypothetical protein
MTLPFLYHKNWLNIPDSDEFMAMGALQYDSVGILMNANSVTGTDVTVSTYCWAENVKVVAPTTQLALQGTPQPAAAMKTRGPPTSSISDEYGKSPVSDIASNVAAVGGALSKIPVIGPFAKATSVVASGVSKVAKWFGWTNVPVISNTMPFKSLPFTAFASSEIGAPVDKLTLDPKNELNIDSRTVGLDGTDELAIESIVTRESFLTTFSWSVSQVSGDQLWYSNVNPSLSRSAIYSAPEAGTTIAYWATPMAHIARTFGCWRGDIVYRFQVICSKFHRGRIRVSWDPLAQIGDVSDTQTTTYTKVIDIAEMTDVYLRIPFMAQTSWLDCDAFNQEFGTGVPSAFNPLRDNGTLRVSVLNNLSAPNSTAGVFIIVSVAGAPNLHFARPVNGIDYTYAEPQSGEDTTGVDTPGANTSETSIASTKDANDDLYTVYMGENVVSMRQYMHRVQFNWAAAPDSNTFSRFQTFQIVMPRRPLCPGFTFGPHTTLSGTNYTYARMTLLTWMSQCFVGHRGSVVIHVNAANAVPSGSITIRRGENRITLASQMLLSWGLGTGTTQSQLGAMQSLYTYSGISGMCLTNQLTQAAASAIMPMYSKYRMLPNYINANDYIDGDETDGITIQSMWNTNKINCTTSVINIYCAAGPDYALFMYLNVPTIYQYDAPFAAS